MKNVLAEEQIRAKNGDISNHAFEELYFRLREKEEKSFLGSMSLRSRQRLHSLVLLIYTIKNHLNGFHFEVIGDKRKSHVSRPVIFAVTHIGKFDIELVSEAIKEHYYLLSGDYEHLQGTVDSKFLNINGVIYFNETVKYDRASVVKKMINHLNDGGNLMYFPEGTWNLTPNLPVIPLYWGVVDIAKKGHAIIVPIAVEQYEKRFVINIGDNFDVKKFLDKKECINCLTDILSTLKWEIWEQECVKREAVSPNYWKMYVNNRLCEWPYFNLEYIEGLTYKPKGLVKKTEAFAHLDCINPNINNAFLFNKRNHN